MFTTLTVIDFDHNPERFRISENEAWKLYLNEIKEDNQHMTDLEAGRKKCSRGLQVPTTDLRQSRILPGLAGEKLKIRMHLPK